MAREEVAEIGRILDSVEERACHSKELGGTGLAQSKTLFKTHFFFALFIFIFIDSGVLLNSHLDHEVMRAPRPCKQA